MIRVLFVCLGNICRSPMAEAVFAHKVREAGLENEIEIDSAGTGAWHVGHPAHHGTLDVLRRNTIPYDGRARQIQADDLAKFDYIVTMDDENLRNVRTLGKSVGHVRPLLAYAPTLFTHEVPDPYYAGGFDKVYELVNSGCTGLLEAIRAEHSL
jgi:protein-tyrosine phosphatase